MAPDERAGPTSGPSFIFGIAIGQAFTGGTPGSGGTIDVHDNIVRRVGYGALLQAADQVTFRRNQVSNTYYGIFAQATTDSAIRRNTIGAKAVGVYLADSADNEVVSNAVSGVGGICYDTSSGGSGTAGTDNHWADNTATVASSPVGICATP